MKLGRPVSERSIRKSVFEALDQIGDGTDRAVLVRQSSIIHGRPLNGGTVWQYRTEWRKQHGSNRDNRTYEGQPRRNMLNDNHLELKQVKALSKFFQQTRLNPATLLTFLKTNDFHSLEQVANGVATMLEIQNAKAA